MKLLAVGLVVTFVALERLALFLIYTFCILFFGYGTYMMLRELFPRLGRKSHAKAA